MTELLEIIAAALERPRELSPQVINHIVETYSIDRDAVGDYLVQELPKLEDYEIDLILSPVFTPKLADQAVFAELLGAGALPREQWPALIQQLAARPTRAQLITSDSRLHSIPLREVAIERYVHRLRLDATIPEPLFKLLDETLPAADRPLLKAVARRAVWETDARRNILARYLSTVAGQTAYSLADTVDLLNLVESYRPTDMDHLLTQLPSLQQALRQELGTGGGPKPFFNNYAQMEHGGGRDQRRQDDARLLAKQNALAFLERLQEVFTSPLRR